MAIKSCRYGDVYKTHLFGYPSIVVAGPQAARFVMVDQACSFRQRGLPLVEMMLGTNFFGYQHEKIHANLKKIFYGPLLPEALERSIPMVEAIAIDILKDWDGKTINTLEEAKKVWHYLYDEIFKKWEFSAFQENYNAQCLIIVFLPEL